MEKRVEEESRVATRAALPPSSQTLMPLKLFIAPLPFPFPATTLLGAFRIRHDFRRFSSSVPMVFLILQVCTNFCLESSRQPLSTEY